MNNKLIKLLICAAIFCMMHTAAAPYAFSSFSSSLIHEEAEMAAQKRAAAAQKRRAAQAAARKKAAEKRVAAAAAAKKKAAAQKIASQRVALAKKSRNPTPTSIQSHIAANIKSKMSKQGGNSIKPVTRGKLTSTTRTDSSNKGVKRVVSTKNSTLTSHYDLKGNLTRTSRFDHTSNKTDISHYNAKGNLTRTVAIDHGSGNISVKKRDENTGAILSHVRIKAPDSGVKNSTSGQTSTKSISTSKTGNNTTTLHVKDNQVTKKVVANDHGKTTTYFNSEGEAHRTVQYDRKASTTTVTSHVVAPDGSKLTRTETTHHKDKTSSVQHTDADGKLVEHVDLNAPTTKTKGAAPSTSSSASSLPQGSQAAAIAGSSDSPTSIGYDKKTGVTTSVFSNRTESMSVGKDGTTTLHANDKQITKKVVLNDQGKTTTYFNSEGEAHHTIQHDHKANTTTITSHVETPDGSKLTRTEITHHKDNTTSVQHTDASGRVVDHVDAKAPPPKPKNTVPSNSPSSVDYDKKTGVTTSVFSNRTESVSVGKDHTTQMTTKYADRSTSTTQRDAAGRVSVTHSNGSEFVAEPVGKNGAQKVSYKDPSGSEFSGTMKNGNARLTRYNKNAEGVADGTRTLHVVKDDGSFAIRTVDKNGVMSGVETKGMHHPDGTVTYQKTTWENGKAGAQSDGVYLPDGTHHSTDAAATGHTGAAGSASAEDNDIEVVRPAHSSSEDAAADRQAKSEEDMAKLQMIMDALKSAADTVAAAKSGNATAPQTQ